MMWNRHDNRAVVPPAGLQSSRDVIYSSYEHAAASPSPLGFGIYACANGNPEDKKPLPMMYVSPAVARDRSPEANPNNAGGVVAGWYVVAQPSTNFEINVTKVHNRMPGTSPENRLKTELFVDGHCANHSMGYQDVEQNFPEHVATGFVEKHSQNGLGSLERKVRKFAFEKATTTEEPVGDFTHSDAGCIRLGVGIGQGILRTRHRTSVQQYTYNSKNVSEKEVAKLGRSLKVRCDGVMAKQKRRLSRYTSVINRELPEATVIVFVREAGWMRSRRLIDDGGAACTHEMFRKLLKADNNSPEDDHDDVKPEEQLVGQAATGTQREGGGGKRWDDVDVIDLT